MKNRNYTGLLALGLVCGLFIMISLAAAAQNQYISTTNTSRYIGKDRWDWTVFIKASPQVLQNILCVEYKLPSTSPNPSRKVCSLGNWDQPFALKSNGWGTFDIPISKVYPNVKTKNQQV